MPNDAISREAAIEAVKWKASRCGECVCILLTEAIDALASLPADARWQELRKYILAIRNGDVPVTHSAGDYVTATCNLILGEFHRLTPAPAEAQPNDVISQEAEDVPKRPQMLLASIGDCSRDVWWTRQGEDLWESQRIFGVATHSSSAGLFVNRDYSDPEAVRLYDQDMAEAQD